MLNFLHSSLLLRKLFKFVLSCELLKHVPSELSLHSLLLFELQSLSLLRVSFRLLHFVALSFSLLNFFLLLTTGSCFVFLLVELSSETVQLFSIFSSPFLFDFESFEDFILGFLFLFSDFFDCFLS